jgi:hypothetical protein
MQNKRNAATFHHQGGNIERNERGRRKGERYVNSETNTRIWGGGGVWRGKVVELLYRQTFYVTFLENPRSENAVFYRRPFFVFGIAWNVHCEWRRLDEWVTLL